MLSWLREFKDVRHNWQWQGFCQGKKGSRAPSHIFLHDAGSKFKYLWAELELVLLGEAWRKKVTTAI